MPSFSGAALGVGGETPFIEKARQQKRKEGFEDLDAQLAIENALQNRKRTGIQEEGVQARLAALQRLLVKDAEWKPVGTPKQTKTGKYLQQQFQPETGQSRWVDPSTGEALQVPDEDFPTAGEIATVKAKGKATAYQELQKAGAPQELLDRFWPPADRLKYFSTEDAGIVGLHTMPGEAAKQPGGVLTGHQGYPPGYGGASPPATNPTLDETDMYYVNQMGSNKMTQDMMAKNYTGRNEYKRRLITAEAMKLGYNPNEALTSVAAQNVATAQSQLDINKPLIGLIDQLGLAHNNRIGYLGWSRLKYGAGANTPGGLADEIANLQLTGITSAAAAMRGSSRAWKALEIALQHTPQVWLDSPQQIRKKLETINNRLQDVINEQKMYGTKSGVPNPQEQDNLPPPRVKVPAPQLPQ